MTIAVLVSLTILGLLSIFQISLAAGAPLGKFAWGGQHKTLPRKLRLGSLSSIFIYAIFAVFILSKSDVISLIPEGSFLDVSLWIIFGYLVIGVFMNAISRSKPERYTMTPTALLLAICVFFIASS